MGRRFACCNGGVAPVSCGKKGAESIGEALDFLKHLCTNVD